MRIIDVLFCLCVVFMVSLGQVMIRHAASRVETSSQWFGWEVAIHGRLTLALLVYGLAMVLWIYVLSRVPLPRAFSFFGLSFFLVPVLAHWMLGDAVSWKIWCGSALICLGIAVSVS